MISAIPSQKDLWNDKHGRGEHEKIRDEPSPLALATIEFIPQDAKILEIGCGVARDAHLFSQNNHHVVAGDLSDTVIQQDTEYFKDDNIDFMVFDASQTLPFSSNMFDVVYSHLALHYYDHQTTTAIVHDITRVLRSEGIFAFACKSINDRHYGKGIEIEPNMFISNGHIRHFFSVDYASELLGDKYEIIVLEELHEQFTDDSVIVQCIARKK